MVGSPHELIGNRIDSIRYADIEYQSTIFQKTDSFKFSYTFTERQQIKNERMLRIRHVAEVPEEDTKAVIMKLINSRIPNTLDNSAVNICERVRRWDNLDDPRDIVVTFTTKKAREAIYKKRNAIQEAGGNDIQILDELVPGRVCIWKEATRRFGLFRVDTAYGAVRVLSCSGGKYHIRSLKQFKRFIERERSLLSKKH